MNDKIDAAQCAYARGDFARGVRQIDPNRIIRIGSFATGAWTHGGLFILVKALIA